jgi:hypothetical protein
MTAPVLVMLSGVSIAEALKAVKVVVVLEIVVPDIAEPTFAKMHRGGRCRNIESVSYS